MRMAEHSVRHERRNFILNGIEGALFMSSAAFISSQTVLPALITRLGGSNVAVGALGVMVYVGLFLPQIFAARYVETLQWKKPWAVSVGLIQRVVILLIGLNLLLFGTTRPSLALWLFLILFCLSQMLMGIATPGWFDLFAKLTPADKRGRLIGLRNSLGGGSSFICGLILIWLLAAFHFPLSYALAFVFAFVFQLASIVVQIKLVEEEPSTAVQRKPMFAFLKELPNVLRRNKEFKRFIISSPFLILATMPVGFFTVYALKHFGATESVVGQFTLTIVATQVVSALVMGYLADRHGNKISLVCSAVGMLCASVWALLAPSLDWFRLVFMFLGVNLGTEVMARYNMSIEYGPAEQRSTYVGLMNTLLAPFYISGMIGGFLSDRFGYATVFYVGILFSLMGISMLVFRVRDPRFLKERMKS